MSWWKKNHVFGYCNGLLLQVLQLNHSRFLLWFFAFYQRPQANGLLMILWFVMHASFFSIIPPLMCNFDHDQFTLHQTIESSKIDQALNSLSLTWKLVNSKYQTTENCKFKLSKLKLFIFLEQVVCTTSHSPTFRWVLATMTLHGGVLLNLFTYLHALEIIL